MGKDKYPRMMVDRMLADTEYQLIFFRNLSLIKKDQLFYPKPRSNGDYTMKCPFHKENTPSMRLWHATNVVKCFGCGWSGNTISVASKYYGISFFEALELLFRIKPVPSYFDIYDPSQYKIPFKEYDWDESVMQENAFENIDYDEDDYPF